MTIELAPGETALFTVDRSTPPWNPSPIDLAEVASIDEWSITVESWDAGEPSCSREDRGLGYETREVRPTTAVTVIDRRAPTLAPWNELPDVGPEVSGVGEYSAVFELDAAADAGERVVLDLGSTNGGLGSVVVNGGDRAVSTRRIRSSTSRMPSVPAGTS